jgi:hypothetical protein
MRNTGMYRKLPEITKTSAVLVVDWMRSISTQCFIELTQTLDTTTKAATYHWPHLCCAGGWLDAVDHHSRLVCSHAQGAAQVWVVHRLEHDAKGAEAAVVAVAHHLTVMRQQTRHNMVQKVE